MAIGINTKIIHTSGENNDAGHKSKLCAVRSYFLTGIKKESPL